MAGIPEQLNMCEELPQGLLHKKTGPLLEPALHSGLIRDVRRTLTASPTQGFLRTRSLFIKKRKTGTPVRKARGPTTGAVSPSRRERWRER